MRVPFADIKDRLVLAMMVIGALASYAIGQDLSNKVDAFTAKPVKEQAHARLEAFAQETANHGQFRVADLPVHDLEATLIDPATTLPQYAKWSLAEAQRMRAADRSCRPDLIANDHSLDAQKLHAWLRYRCQPNTPLPENFLAQYPFMHPTGQSYAALFAATTTSPSDLLPYFHVLEYQDLELALGPQLEAAAKLTRAQLGHVFYRSILAYGPEVVLIYDGQHHDRHGLNYRVFATADWQAFDFGRYFETRADGGTGPFAIGNVSFYPREQLLARDLRFASHLQTAGVALLVLAVLYAVSRLMAIRRTELERRIFNVQMLAHELRTPVAAINVDLEAFRERYDSLPDALKGSYARLQETTARLGRLMAASTQYLQSISAKTLRFDHVTIDSVAAFVEDVVAEHQAVVSITPHLKDRRASFDPYWVKFCLDNLIRNALDHGAPPVEVGWRATRRELIFFVKDQGRLTSQEQRELTEPFARHPASQGLGLGLTLVAQIAREMGGRLEITGQPTTIAFSLPERSP